jgi:hypothetical protein
MDRVLLSFGKLNPLEQEWFLTETWCDHCREADLGILDPVYYRLGKMEFIEGKCKVCNQIQQTQILVRNLHS